MLQWFGKIGIQQGIFWGVLLNCTGALNDVLARLLGERLHFVEISFFRFFFSTVIVLIPMICRGKKLFETKMHATHVLRGCLGAVALGLCCLGVNIMPLAENATILFADTFFTIALAMAFLRERPRMSAIAALVTGVVGVLIMFRPCGDKLNLVAFIPTAAAFIFAVSNIIIKRMVGLKEHTLTMLFYFGLYSSMLSCLFLPLYWTAPTPHELMLLFLLGVGANVIQVFVFLAFRATDASNVSPLRFVELPFAILFGYTFFGQTPDLTSLFGAALIIAGAATSWVGSRSNPKLS